MGEVTVSLPNVTDAQFAALVGLAVQQVPSEANLPYEVV